MDTRPLDTSPDALEVQRSAFADLGPDARFRAALEMSEAVRQIRLSGLRERHPDASESELVDRLVEQLYGPGSEVGASRFIPARRVPKDYRGGLISPARPGSAG